MTDNDQKKIMRWFTITWFFLLAMIFAIIFLAVHDSKPQTIIKNYIGQKGESVTGPQGAIGPVGPQGTPGEMKTIETQKVVHETVVTPGDKGEKGDQGPIGRSMEWQFTPQEGLLTKYSDDTFWQVTIPCEFFIMGCGEEDGSTVNNP